MRIMIPFLLAALLGACGYKGPLYLPQPAAASRPAQPAPHQDRQAAPQEPAGK
ncbi:MAG: LPS translocon maturation chaperone LptM [Burkholderiales bacterium]